MAVYHIEVKQLTPEAFAPYGTVVDWPEHPEEYYAFHSDRFDFIPKLGTLNEQGLAEISSALYWAAHISGALLVLALGQFLKARSARQSSISE